jgi:hypothetical protein
MKTPEYRTLDDAIVAAITDGATKFEAICAACANVPMVPNPNGEAPVWRAIDRRLQLLSKANRIEYRRPGGWVLRA